MSKAAAAVISKTSDFTDPKLYINRELSLLAFQRRVLEEAQDAQNRLLERPKFSFHSLLEFGRVLHGPSRSTVMQPGKSGKLTP